MSCVTTAVSKLTSHTSHINKRQKMVENTIMARSRPFSKQYISFKFRYIQCYVYNTLCGGFCLRFHIAHVGGHPVFCHACHTSQ